MSSIITAPKIPKRAENAHKGTYGTALLICGSFGLAGAAVLAARAALRSGVGIAKCIVPKSIYPIVGKAVPEAVFLPTGRKRLSIGSAWQAKKAVKTASSVLIGCGLSKGYFCKRTLKAVVKNAKCPVIIDADGINLLSSCINILKQAGSIVILTPHPGEMSRLCGKSIAEIEADRESAAKKFAVEHKVYLVLKGKNTVVATPNGEIYINPTGNAGMATGGSGDTLSGIMAAFLAAEKDILSAVNKSVYIHGLAGDMAAADLSQASMLPTDMTERLPAIFKMLEG